MHEAIRFRIEESVAIKEGLLGQIPILVQVAEVLIRSYQQGGKAIFFGNGGSAADAQHLAAELGGRFYFDRKPLPALALSVNTSLLTAIGNDYGYEQIFSRQMLAVGEAGDVAIGISTSGNSPNILQCILTAKEKGLVAVGLTGEAGSKLKEEVDYWIHVPSGDTPRIQEGHILIGHILCELIERALFNAER